MKRGQSFIALDLETTGLAPKKDRILEIGAVKIIDGTESGRLQLLTDPQMEIPQRIVELTGITEEMVRGKQTNAEAVREFLAFAEDLPLLGHNILFDYSFIKHQAVNQGLAFEREAVDTLKISRSLLSDLESRSLEFLCKHFKIENPSAHRALADAKAAWELYQILWEHYAKEREELFVPQPLVYKVKKQGPITKAQISYLKSLLLQHGLKLNVKIESMTKNEASRKIDSIIAEYGRGQRKEKERI